MISDLMESSIPSKTKQYSPSKHYIDIKKCVFDISQTKKDLNYEPIVNMNDAIDRTIKSLKV